MPVALSVLEAMSGVRISVLLQNLPNVSLAVVEDTATEERRPAAVDFFRNEYVQVHCLNPLILKFSYPRFELDYLLASLKKPYIAILDGTTSTYILFKWRFIVLTFNSHIQWVVVMG